MRPISASGWRTDVSCGVTISAWLVSSKPTTDRSSGTERPRSARGVQRADRDVVVEAEDRRRRIGQRRAAARAASFALRDPPVGVDDQLRVEQDARAGERGAEAEQPLLGRVPAGRAGDRADAAVAELEQVLGRLLRTGRVHRGDARRCPRAAARAGRRRRTGSPARCSVRSSSADSSGQHQDRAVGRPAHQALEQRDLAVVLVERRGEHDPHVALVERLGRAAQHRPEVRVGDERQRQADHAGAAAREPAGAAVRAEAVLADDLEHGLAGVRARRRAGR